MTEELNAAGRAAPLAGVRVLDLTQNVAGPFATQILADLGADVLKVEKRGGDDTRAWGPPFLEGESPVFLALNRNKRSICLDFRDADDRQTLDGLVAVADVLVESLHPGTVAELGLGPDWAHALNPRLHYCSISAYGSPGPLEGKPGYDPLMQAFSGIMSVTGIPGNPPARVGVSIVDMGTGLWAAIGVLAAMARKDAASASSGQVLEVSLYETALAWMSYHLIGYWGTGEEPAPQGGGVPFLCPYGTFPASDGHVVIAAGNDRLFRRLCSVLSLELDPDDERYATNPGRVENRAAVERAVACRTKLMTCYELERALANSGVPCAPVRSIGAVADDPQAAALDIYQPTPHHSIDGLRTVGLPIVFDRARPASRLGPPGRPSGQSQPPEEWQPIELGRARSSNRPGH